MFFFLWKVGRGKERGRGGGDRISPSLPQNTSLLSYANLYSVAVSVFGFKFSSQMSVFSSVNGHFSVTFHEKETRLER